MHWIDIVFIAIILIFAIIGLVKGLFDSILSLCASVASIFLSFWAGKPVAAFLNKLVDVNGFFVKGLSSIGVEAIGDYSLDQLATICTIALSMVLVFILIKVAVWLLAKLFDSVTASSTAISGLNRLFGLIFGAVQGFAIVLVALGLTSIVGMVPDLGSKINSFLEPSKITRVTYNYVDEWVQDELSEKIDEFVKDLSKTDLTPDVPTTNYAQIIADELTSADFTNDVEITDTSFLFDTTFEKYSGNVKVSVSQNQDIAIKYYEVIAVGNDNSITPSTTQQDGGKILVSGLNPNTTYKVVIALNLVDEAGSTATTTIEFNVTTTSTSGGAE